MELYNAHSCGVCDGHVLEALDDLRAKDFGFEWGIFGKGPFGEKGV